MHNAILNLEVEETKKWIKIAMLALGILTVSFISLSYASHVWYGDLRDYYPGGLYVRAYRLNGQPAIWIELKNDTYIQKAVDKVGNLTFNPDVNTWIRNWTWVMQNVDWNWTWVQQDDPNSEFMKKGMPEYILWAPDGNYYFIHARWLDGIPESFKHLPSPGETVALLSIPWIMLIGMVIRERHKQ